jgi:hypothetical protein
MPAQFFKLMRMEVPPEKGDYFTSTYDFAKHHLKLDFAGQTKFDEQVAQALRQPWLEKDFPHAAAWLKANEKPLGLVVEAAKRTHCFSPLLPTSDQKTITDLGITFAPSGATCHHLAKALACRAMLRLGAAREDDAWQDILSCHRLARHLARGGFLIDRLFGNSIEIVASESELAFVAYCKGDSTKILKCLSDINALPVLPTIADSFDFAERLFFLDYIMHAARGGITRIETLLLMLELEFDKVTERERIKPKLDMQIEALLDDVDWDLALRQRNKWCDRMVAALREPGRATREKKLDELENESNELQIARVKASDLVKALVAIKSDAAAKSQLICKLFAGSGDSTRNIQRVVDRAEQSQRNLHIAFALAAYQREHGKYPEKLDALAPKYLAKIPNDLFTDKPLVYRPNEKGYLLYSFGPDGKDNDGKTRDEDVTSDDIGVRLPLPK